MTVEDIMDLTFAKININSSLKDLSDYFYENNTEYLLVVDDKDIVIGEVSVLDYMMAAFPEYARKFEKLSFMKRFEPFENLLKNEKDIKLETIIKPITGKVTPQTTIHDAVFLMSKLGRQELPIIKNNHPIGIISIVDIYKKVIKG